MSISKIVFNPIRKFEKLKQKKTEIFALDTENSNKNDIESITYCTQLMNIGIKDSKSSCFKETEDNTLYLFTEPSKAWKYILNTEYQNVLLVCFNADYDLPNLLNWLIKDYNINPKNLKYEYNNRGELIRAKKQEPQPMTYEIIDTNGSYIQCTITLNKTKKAGYRTITILDIAHRLTGSLASNVKTFCNYEMSKEGLNYSIYRDFGHTDYTEAELKYIYEDVYYLKKLYIEVVINRKMTKLTIGGYVLNLYKNHLLEEFKENYNNKEHKLYKLFKDYFKYSSIAGHYEYIMKTDNDKLGAQSLKDKVEAQELSKEEFILKHTSLNSLFSYIYPPIEEPGLFVKLFKSYKGGITRYNQGVEPGAWIEGQGLYLDINSSYPNSMANYLLPYGKPKHKKGKYILKKNKVYLQKIRIYDFKVIEGKEPIIQTPKKELKTKETWSKSYIGVLELYVTNAELDYIVKNYDYRKIEYIDYLEFNATTELFKPFITEHYKTKQEAQKGSIERELAKLILNNLYGKFGTNALKERRLYDYSKGENALISEIYKDENGNTEYETINQVYLPVAMFTTAYSRLNLVEAMNRANANKNLKWLYSDTDSIMILGDKEEIIKTMDNLYDKEASGALGLWKLEQEFNELKVLGIKKYIIYNEGKYKCTLSGINKKHFKQIEEDLKSNKEIINIASKEDYELLQEGKYYTKQIIETGEYMPYCYRDKNCTEIMQGCFITPRKHQVKNGVILKNQAYAIVNNN